MSDLATALPCRRPELVARPFGENGSYLVRDRHQGESFQLGPDGAVRLLLASEGRAAADRRAGTLALTHGGGVARPESWRCVHDARPPGQEHQDRRGGWDRGMSRARSS
jgi:hypothetical protein